MNTTNELLQKLNTMQNEHIKILEERIKVLMQTIEDYAKGGVIDNIIHPYILQQKVGKQLKTIKGLTQAEDRKITNKMLEEKNQQVSININYSINANLNNKSNV